MLQARTRPLRRRVPVGFGGREGGGEGVHAEAGRRRQMAVAVGAGCWLACWLQAETLPTGRVTHSFLQLTSAIRLFFLIDYTSYPYGYGLVYTCAARS
eukprot:COSAG01_NODE_18099_length_1100_cov_238.090909_1_plen_98_part_00